MEHVDEAITFKHVSKVYASGERPAVDDVSLTVPAGAFVVLLGPSGSGKTTLLKMVNRLFEPTSGSICIGDTDIRDMEVTTLRRRIGYVIQQIGLFPHMTVERNIAVVPQLLGWDRRRIAARIDELLDLVDLPREYRTRHPSQLSGGQQQRVGLARALAADPMLLLMDEPFGAADAITRASLQDQMLELQRRVRKTVLFVTHDVDEALILADRIAVLRDGRLVQYDEPCVLLTEPADDFVRELVNADDRIRQLSLLRVEAVMRPLDAVAPPAASPRLAAGEDVRQALSILLRPDASAITVMDGDRPVGVVTLDSIRLAACEDGAQ